MKCMERVRERRSAEARTGVAEVAERQKEFGAGF